MTNTEAITILRDLYIELYPASLIRADEAIRVAIKALKKAEYYKWHSDPKDLPKDERDVLVYAVEKNYGHAIVAFYDTENCIWISNASNDFKVIAWRHMVRYEGD